ncbi:MAG: hypothetical protein J0I06_19350 [Planctomycetes bacterium]|nr:hypothetical protein [Planctomycetota bacterium]
MPQLGKPLVFYLKHMAEMNRLYAHDEDEEPDLTGLADADRVREMSRAVGAAADGLAADFAELCNRGFEEHFTKSGAAVFTSKRKRSYNLQNWGGNARFEVPSVPGGWFSCGAWLTAPPEVRVPLPEGACGFVVVWLWAKGGRKGAEAIWKALGGRAHSRGEEGAIDGNGSVALACVPIRPEPPDSFDVDRDRLLSEVLKTMTCVGPQEVKAIAGFVAGLTEADES